MKYLVPFALMATLSACKGSTQDSQTSQDTQGTQDTGVCNTDNENCGPHESGCGGEGRNMLPGSSCLSCHTQGLMPKEDEPDKWFSVAGTVFNAPGEVGVENATVRVTDSKGTVVELTSSSSGNFYSRKSLVPPLSAEVEQGGQISAMITSVETGDCNTCHQCDGASGGKLHP